MANSRKSDWRPVILRIFRESPRQTFRQRDLVRRLGIKQTELNTFKIALRRLIESKEIRRIKRGLYILGRQDKHIEGRLTINQKGFGFVLRPEPEPDIYIGRRNLGNAVNGDLVRVKLLPGNRFEGPRGIINRVIERGTSQFVGTVFQEKQHSFLAIQPVTSPRGIRILPGRKIRFSPGQVVIAEVKDWGSHTSPVLVRVVKVLGEVDDPANDVNIVMAKYGYDTAFPGTVETEIGKFSQKMIDREADGREDFRSLMTFTIDPESARDFDDAISLERTDSGYCLMVHIADVSYFVTPGSLLDREARSRGTSVYFDDATVHMLPEELSAVLCSLQPEVDRLAVSAVIDLNRHYRVVDSRVTLTVINSNYRFTYQQVQAVLNDDKTHPERKRLLDLQRICRALRKQRMKMGSIDFDIPEPLFSMSADGIPHEIKPSERLESHRIVEECMLLANRLVAEKIPMKGEETVPFIYRVHDEPPAGDVEGFLDLLKRIGITHQSSQKRLTSAGMRDILLQVENSPHRNLVENLALRTMTKALYAVDRRGHFGLAFSVYTHFTSPIRRYPDLAVHRLIKEYSRSVNTPESTAVEDLLSITETSTASEIKALEAEREYIKLKQLRWLQQQVGKQFTGIISGVTSLGFYVQLADSLVEGLVHISTLEGDDFIHDTEHYCLRGRRYGHQFSLGDAVEVLVQEVLIDKLRANFRLSDGN